MTKPTFREKVKAASVEYDEQQRLKRISKGKPDREVEKPVKKVVETKSFKDIREDFKRDTAEIKKEYSEQREKDKADIAEYKANQPTGTKRMTNTLVKGLSLWLAIPALLFIFVVGLFVVVGLWDWIVGLFN